MDNILGKPPLAILHVPHSSVLIPERERGAIRISEAELAVELLRMTDYFTDHLFTCEASNRKVVYPVSRLVCDPERFVNDEDEPMAEKGFGIIYEKTSTGRPLRVKPSSSERERILEQYYRPHHEVLTKSVDKVLEHWGRCLIIDCHSFSSIPLPFEDETLMRPDICIGTDDFHTPSWLKDIAISFFEEQRLSVLPNEPYSGTLVPLKHLEHYENVWSVMIEVNRKLYLNEKTGERSVDCYKTHDEIGTVLNKLIHEAEIHTYS